MTMADEKQAQKRVTYHGFAHLLLTLLLFFIAVVVFGGWTEGPLTSGLFLGTKAYGLIAGASAGNLDAANLLGASVLQLAIIFIVNLVIFYAISAVLIFLFNLFFGK